MLTEIRERSSGWFAWVIAGLIIVPMAFWGIQEYANPEADPAIVEIGDQKITVRQFENQFAQSQQQARSRLGENADNSYLASDQFKQSVLQSMINAAIVEHIAESERYRLSDTQLAEAIRNAELFKLDGEFNEEAYERYIQGSGYSKTQFENAMRSDETRTQVLQGYAESAIVLPQEMRELLQIQAERKTFDLLTVRSADYFQPDLIAEPLMQDYYDANLAEFMLDEQMRVSYVELNASQLTEEAEISEDELRTIYEENQLAYQSEESRQTRHILLNVEDDNGSEVKNRAEALVEQLRAGADFAELAKQHSADTGSANLGGDLGLVERGQMVEEFEQVTFALDEDEISDPVRSPFGYHIIQVTRIEAPEQQPFDEVRDSLLADEVAQRGKERILELRDELQNLAFEQSDNLDGVAEALDLQVRESLFFSRESGTGVAANANLREAAFSEEVRIDDNNSEPIEIGDDVYVVVRKLELKEPTPQEFELVKEEIRSKLAQQRATIRAQERGDAVFAIAKSTWGDLSEKEQLVPQQYTVSLIDSNPNLSPTLLSALSKMSLTDDTPLIQKVSDINGDVHIVRLTEVAPGDLSQVPAQVKDATRRILEQRNGETLFAAYLENLRQELELEIDQNLL